MENVKQTENNGGFNIGDYVLYNNAIYFIEGREQGRSRWPYNVF